MKRRLHLQTEMNILISAFCLVIIVFQIIISIYYESSFLRQQENIKETLGTSIQSRLQSKLDDLDKIQKIVTQNQSVISVMKNPDDKLAASSLGDMIYMSQHLYSDTIHSYIFTVSGEPISISGNNSAFETEYIKKLSGEFTATDTNTTVYRFFRNEEMGYNHFYLLSLVPVYEHDYKTVTSKKVGTSCIFIQVDSDAFFYDLQNVDSLVIYLNSGDTEIKIYSKNSTEMSRKPLRFRKSLPGSGFYISGQATYSSANSIIRPLSLLVFFESTLLLLMIIIYHFFIRNSILRPIEKLKNYINEFTLSEAFHPIEAKGNIDITELFEAINSMTLRNKRLANDVLYNQQRLFDAERLKDSAVLYALQNQVNPHFMYNVFELMRSIAIVYNVKELETVSVNISKILRYNLKKDSLVTVRDEIDIINKYIEIMRIKYDDSFDFLCDIPEDIKDEPVMKMLFQPIVENSFNHGFVRRKNKFKTSITAHREGSGICFVFFDNGLGIDKASLEEILHNFAKDDTIYEKQIGLANLNYRLKMCYADNYSINIDTKENEFTKITVIIKRTDER